MMASGEERGDESCAVVVDVVIKLGGSAITDKSSFKTLQEEQLQQGAALIKLCHDAGQTIAVVHGAGSFGHFLAKKYQLSKGLNKERNYQGFCETRNSVSKLNKYVVECLTEHGVPAISCPAFPCWQTCGGSVVEWPTAAIRRVLRSGLVPVLHGDGVLDTRQGYAILSGDTIIQTLCRSFTVDRVVFLSDVQGVYDKPPTEEGAQLVRTVGLKDGEVCGDVTLSTSSHDVTGGMLNKLRSAHRIVTAPSAHTRVFVSKIGTTDAQKLCLEKNIDIKTLAATEIIK
ncbi:hypothetical protein ACOMHN_035054 [Nucella lapillus]